MKLLGKKSTPWLPKEMILSPTSVVVIVTRVLSLPESSSSHIGLRVAGYFQNEWTLICYFITHPGWTLNERYSEEPYPSLDSRPDADEDVDARNHPLRIHRSRINQREDSLIFVFGRAYLPARHRQTI